MGRANLLCDLNRELLGPSHYTILTLSIVPVRDVVPLTWEPFISSMSPLSPLV